MEEPAQVTKKCSECKIKKKISEFSKDKSKVDLLQNRCKQCQSNYYKTNKEEIAKKGVDYRKTHKKDIIERHLKYYKKKKDDILKYNENYRRTHKNEKIAWALKYRKIHKEESADYSMEYRKTQMENPEFVETPQLWYFNKIKKRNKYSSTLTYQELLGSNHCKNCCFCGTELKFTKTSYQASGNQNASLDRIDSSKGYEVGNIQWCCWKCNHLKSTFSQGEFIQLCNNIAHTNPRPYLAC